MRLYLLVISLSMSFGILFPWDWNYIGLRIRWQVWHEHFTNCHFVSERKHGSKILIDHPSVGLTPAQAVKIFGLPDVRWWMQVAPGAGMMKRVPTTSEIKTGQVVDNWFYTKHHYICLHFKNGVCVSALPSPNSCEHMLP